MGRINFRNPLFFIFTLCLLLWCAIAVVQGVVAPLFLVAFMILVLFTMPKLNQVGAVKIRESLETITLIKYSNAGATVADMVYLFNTRVGLAMNTVGAGLLNVYMICGLIEYKSETGVAWTAGDKIYWDDTANKQFTKTSAGNTLAGIVYEDKASAAATGFVLLWPAA